MINNLFNTNIFDKQSISSLEEFINTIKPLIEDILFKATESLIPLVTKNNVLNICTSVEKFVSLRKKNRMLF